MDNKLDQKNLIFEYKIFNNGPSKIEKLLVTFQIPVIYIQQSSFKIIDINKTNATVLYSNKVIDTYWVGNEELSNQVRKTSTARHPTANIKAEHDEKFDQNLLTLPKNRTISVSNHQLRYIDIEFVVEELIPDKEPVVISLNISFDLRQFGKNFDDNY